MAGRYPDIIGLIIWLGLACYSLNQAPPAQAIEPGLDVETYTLSPPTSEGSPRLRFGPENDKQDHRAKIVTILAVGDTGLNAHMAPLHPDGGYKHGRLVPWTQASRNIEDEIDGDLNFLNLETIVTANSRIAHVPKAFNFRMHPNGARHLVDIGFNLFSTANNHAMDFGRAGARDTLRYLENLRADGLLAWPGLGRDRRQAGKPSLVRINGVTIAASAVGIGPNGFLRRRSRIRADRRRVGFMSYRSRDDFLEVVERLADSRAAYSILSVHYGIERAVRVERDAIKLLRGIASQGANTDLVLGHHAHVARGIELNGERVIIYGLGNFLHHGTANMGGMDLCRDFGLMVKLHLKQRTDGHLVMRAMEALPLTAMHQQTRLMSPSKARKRIHVLNYLSRQLEAPEQGAKGARFVPRNDGTGIYCVPGAEGDPGRIGRLCRNWQSLVRSETQPSRSLARRIARSCGRVGYASASRSKRRRGRRSRHRKAGTSGNSGSLFQSIFGN